MGSYIGDNANGGKNEISHEGKLQGTVCIVSTLRKGLHIGNFKEHSVSWDICKQVLQKGSFEEKPFKGANFQEGSIKGQCQGRPSKTINTPGFLLFATLQLQGLFRSSASTTDYRAFQACSVFFIFFLHVELLICPVSWWLPCV
jgi:hypothetical protein